MPIRSVAQRRWMWANKPKMARRWEEHTPKGIKLPKRVRKAHWDSAEHPRDAQGQFADVWGDAPHERLMGLKGAWADWERAGVTEMNSAQIAALGDPRLEVTGYAGSILGGDPVAARWQGDHVQITAEGWDRSDPDSRRFLLAHETSHAAAGDVLANNSEKDAILGPFRNTPGGQTFSEDALIFPGERDTFARGPEEMMADVGAILLTYGRNVLWDRFENEKQYDISPTPPNPKLLKLYEAVADALDRVGNPPPDHITKDAAFEAKHPRGYHGYFAGAGEIQPGETESGKEGWNKLTGVMYRSAAAPDQQGEAAHLKQKNVDEISAALAERAKSDPALSEQLTTIGYLNMSPEHFKNGKTKGIGMTDYHSSQLHVRAGETVQKVGARDVAVRLQDAWATSASDESAMSWAVQLAAAEHLGVDTSEARQAINETWDRRPTVRNIYTDYSYLFGLKGGGQTLPSQTENIAHSPAVKAYVDEVYARTQKLLADNDITGEVTLMRGMAFPGTPKQDPLWHVDPWTPTDAEVPMNPLASFTVEYGTAKSFAKYAKKPIGLKGSDESMNAYIVTGSVPVERIFSTPMTGPGCLRETEVLVVGGRAAKFKVRQEEG